MFKKSIIATVCVALFTATAATAGSASDGLISYVYVMSSGKVVFSHSGTRTAAPACATQAANFAFDASTAGGQALLSQLLTSYTKHQVVRINGTGACLPGFDAEAVDWVLAVG